MIQTLTIETVPDRKGLWLVAININGESTPLAKFTNEAAKDLYLQLTINKINQAYTSGQMGI